MWRIVGLALVAAFVVLLAVFLRATYLPASAKDSAAEKITEAQKVSLPTVPPSVVRVVQPVLTPTPSVSAAQATQTAVASVTIDAATRIAIAAHQLVYTTPQPVSVLDPTPSPAPATPTIPLNAFNTHGLALPTATPVSQGTVADAELYSPILNRSLPYRVYLPPNYADSSLRYPVLYMLHGYSGSYKEWTDYGLLTRADAMIRAGQVPPFIIVLPMGELGYWLNHANGGPRWADYLAYDVVGYIDATYRTIANRDNRAIGGLSMGGYGALEIGFNYPNVFKIVGAHSPSIRTQAQGTDVWGTDPAYFAQVDPLELAQTRDLSGYKIWLDVGNADTQWEPVTQQLHTILQQRGIAHSWNLFPGDHAGIYWITHVPDYISFYGHAFSNRY